MSRYSIFLGIIWLFFVALSLYLTPTSLSLESDALGYYQEAQSAVNNHSVFRQWFAPSQYFGDYGYTFILGLAMMLTGSTHVLVFQVINYLLWALASYFVYRSLKLLSAPSWTRYLVFFSPVFLTFSSKLYSEPYTALGLSMLFFSFLSGGSMVIYIVGGFILLSAKSSFLPLLLIPIIFGLLHRNYRLVLFTLILPILTLSNFLGHANRERSNLVLAIQTSKIAWSYDTIGACTLYYISYPLGQAIFPGYQGACHPNNPEPDMPMVAQNPYGLGAKVVERQDYNFVEAVLSNPLKYMILMMSNLGVIVWFEGVYPSILLQLPSYLWPPLYLIFKVLLSLYFWFRILTYASKLAKISLPGALLYLSPLLFFAVVYGNFHEEQRYFYPLIPYMYLVFGLSWIKPTVLITKFGKVYTDPVNK